MIVNGCDIQEFARQLPRMYKVSTGARTHTRHTGKKHYPNTHTVIYLVI